MSRKGQIIPSSDVMDFENSLPGGVYNATPPVATNGQYVPDQMDAGGNKKVTIVASSGGASAMTIAEDVAETAGEQIVKNGRVRRDTPASSAGTTGDWSTANNDALGHDWVREGYAPLYENNVTGKAVVEHQYTNARVTADGQVKATAGFIHTVTFSATGAVTAGVITIYNNTAESGTVLWSGTIQVATAPVTITLDVEATTAIYVGYDGTIANVATSLSYR